MGAAQLIPRQPVGPLTVSTWLDHLSVVTWSIPPGRLSGVLPPTLSPVLCDGAALISAVTFCNRDFRLAWLPLGGMRLGQTNYRIYVRDASGQPAVYFVGTTIDTVMVVVPRSLWRMPWRRARYRFTTHGEGDSGLTVEAQGEWPARLRLSGRGAPLTALPGFASLSDGLDTLTQPWVGLYGAGRRYTIWHPPYAAGAARLEEARFGLLDALGLVPLAEQGTPHSVITADPVRYLIYLPPRAG